ncbi:MAG: DUF1634 domain-containing protein [Hyphomonas sp.]|jgi:uncharacterized membrane protein|nr:DUF1634 domain-containing protein [Hyphomonas sp.]
MREDFGTEAREEWAIAMLLYYGTITASFVIALGLLVQWLPLSANAPLLGLNGLDLMKAGIALFIILPVLRVALMLLQFVQARDIAYVAISAFVLAIIGTGFLAKL